jgi:hypothetical protein
MHDYIRSVWVLPGGTKVWLDWVFLWPLEEQAGTVASIMTQGRLGSAIPHNWSWLKLYSGQVKVIRVDRNGTVELGDGKTGLRCGSR